MKELIFQYIQKEGPVSHFQIAVHFGKSDMLGVLYMTRMSLKSNDELGTLDGIKRFEAMVNTYYKHYVDQLVAEGKVTWNEDFYLEVRDSK